MKMPKTRLALSTLASLLLGSSCLPTMIPPTGLSPTTARETSVGLGLLAQTDPGPRTDGWLTPTAHVAHHRRVKHRPVAFDWGYGLAASFPSEEGGIFAPGLFARLGYATETVYVGVQADAGLFYAGAGPVAALSVGPVSATVGGRAFGMLATRDEDLFFSVASSWALQVPGALMVDVSDHVAVGIVGDATWTPYPDGTYRTTARESPWVRGTVTVAHRF